MNFIGYVSLFTSIGMHRCALDCAFIQSFKQALHFGSCMYLGSTSFTCIPFQFLASSGWIMKELCLKPWKTAVRKCRPVVFKVLSQDTTASSEIGMIWCSSGHFACISTMMGQSAILSQSGNRAALWNQMLWPQERFSEMLDQAHGLWFAYPWCRQYWAWWNDLFKACSSCSAYTHTVFKANLISVIYLCIMTILQHRLAWHTKINKKTKTPGLRFKDVHKILHGLKAGGKREKKHLKMNPYWGKCLCFKWVILGKCAQIC